MTTSAQAAEPPYLLGHGFVGEVLWTFGVFPPQRVDAHLWSYTHAADGRPSLLSDACVRSLVDGGWCRVEPSILPGRTDQLVVTESGGRVLAEWCWRRARQLSDVDDIGVVAQQSVYAATRAEIVARLVDRALELGEYLAAATAGAREPVVDAVRDDLAAYRIGLADGETNEFTGLSAWFSSAPDASVRTRRVRAALKEVAETAMHGLALVDMPVAAALFGQLAVAAFSEAPDQDWEPGDAAGEDV